MLIKVKYLGYSAFEVKSFDGVTVVTDPYNDTVGFTFPKDLKADIVLISHDHSAHNCIEAVSGDPAIIQGAGYRELGWIKIKGIKTFHDRVSGDKYGQNTVFCWDMRAVKLCHLGDLGHIPDPEILEQIGPVDVLFLPIGGNTVLDPTEAARVMDLITCRYVVPMHYRTEYNSKDFRYTLQDFLAGKKNVIYPEKSNEFVLTRQDLAEKGKKIISLQYLEELKLKSKTDKTYAQKK